MRPGFEQFEPMPEFFSHNEKEPEPLKQPERQLLVEATNELEWKGYEREEIKERLRDQTILYFDPPIFAVNERDKVIDDTLKGAEIPKGAHSIATYLKHHFDAKPMIVPMDIFIPRERGIKPQEELVRSKIFETIDYFVEKTNPKVINFGLNYTFTEPFLIEMTRYVKEKYPSISTVVGGNSATFTWEQLLDSERNTGIDVVVPYEGEEKSAQLLAELLGQSPDLSRMPGIAFRDKEGSIHPPHGKDRAFDPTELPALDYSIIQMPDGIDLTNFNHTVMFLRGCGASCSFCTSPAFSKKNLRYGTLEGFMAEIEYLAENDVKAIGLLDDDILGKYDSKIVSLQQIHRLDIADPKHKVAYEFHKERSSNPTPWEVVFPGLKELHDKKPELQFFVQGRVPPLVARDASVGGGPIYRLGDEYRRDLPDGSFESISKENLAWDPTSNDGLIRQMIDAGVQCIYLGIESGNDEILQAMQKGNTVANSLAGLRNIKAVNESLKPGEKKLEAGAFWIFGHPGATKKNEDESLKFMEQILQEGLVDHLEVHIAAPFPGTKMAKDPRIELNDLAKDTRNYGIINNDPVYHLVKVEGPRGSERPVIDQATGKAEIELTESQIRTYLDKALALRKQYLGIDPTETTVTIT